MALRMECGALDHLGAVVRSKPSCIAFVLTYELPIPWPYLTDALEERILKHCSTRCCLPALIIPPFFRSALTGRETWTLHCHCDQPNTLQCMAGSAVTARFVQQFVDGTYFNSVFWFYYQYVNEYAYKEARYVGSSVVNGIHFICLRFARKKYLRACLEIDYGPHLICSGIGQWVILLCKSCADGTESSARACMYRTREIVEKMGTVLRERRQLLRPFATRFNRPNLFPRLHDDMAFEKFFRLFRYHEPVPLPFCISYI